MTGQGLYLVDTSAWIFALRRTPNETIRRRIYGLGQQDALATCGVVELELLGGAANQREFERLEDQLKGLRRLLVEESDWNSAARLAFSLRRAGVTVPYLDLLLSALALRHSAVLVHADRDFDVIAGHSDLQVESLVDAVSG